MTTGRYFDGRQPQATRVDLSFEGDTLKIEAGGSVLGRWPTAMIRRDPTRLTHLVLSCAGGDERLEVDEPQVFAHLNLDATTWFTSWVRQRTLWFASAFALFMIGLGYLAWNSRLVTRPLARLVGPKLNIHLRALIDGQSASKYCKLSPQQKAALDRVLHRLNAPERVEIVRLDMENAFTLPGQIIWVTAPLLKSMESPDEFAGILAHEIEHLERGHVTEALIRSVAFTGAFTLLFGDVSGFLLVDPQTLVQVLTLRLSREMETEADQGALKRLQAAKVSTHGMREFFKRRAGRDASAMLSFLSTHPDSAEREKLFETSDHEPSTSPLLGPEEWTDLQNACDGAHSETGP